MVLTPEQEGSLKNFFNQSNFSEHGAVITDLDGTAVHEREGRTVIHSSVELGLKLINDLRRPIVINTLRFPLSVIRTFGAQWYTLTGSAIPVVLLNGSQIGYIHQEGEEFRFEQLFSKTLTGTEIGGVMQTVTQLTADGMDNLLVFFYREDWTQGELIWTPVADRIGAVQEKYQSASTVLSTPVSDLDAILSKEPVCMVFLLIEAPEDKLMAYQHSKRSNFITAEGVNKLSGAHAIADILQFNLKDSIGAGDTPMDTFLDGVGLSVHVHHPELPFKGVYETVRVPHFEGFGEALYQFATWQRQTVHS
mgnify:CR=1 FL=1